MRSAASEHWPIPLYDFEEEHLFKGRPVKKLMYVPPAEDKPVPKMKDIEFFKHQRLIVLRNRGRIDPEKIDEYIAFDGYEALGKALTGMTPEQILTEICDSGLRGRGGAGFPTGKKWAACAKGKKTPKYIICNIEELHRTRQMSSISFISFEDWASPPKTKRRSW